MEPPLPVGRLSRTRYLENLMVPNPKRVAARWSATRTSGGRSKQAGEIRHVKDRTEDSAETWGWPANPPPSSREIQKDVFVFNAKYLKPLAKSMRSGLMALGHAAAAYETFTKIKSRNISPDGSLGGKGYIQRIPDMRKQLMNCVEALSAFTDTVYDEINAPHWNPSEDTLDPRTRKQVVQIVRDSEKIKQDPESWAGEAEEEAVEDLREEDAVEEDAVEEDAVEEELESDFETHEKKKLASRGVRKYRV